jgi:Arc/MetJ-type ribon-helix-helix transcriptional regulator
VRPNIDIPWSVHGEIKELVEEGYYDDLDDAYETVLREGLDG